MQRLITIFLLSIVLLVPVTGQTVPTGLVEAIREGNEKKMSEYFHKSLEITILEN